MVSIAEQKSQIAQLRLLLEGNRIVFTDIDCSLEENKDARDFYFKHSGVRGNYPQVFLQDADGVDVQFLGSFKEIQVQSSSLTARVSQYRRLILGSWTVRRS